MTIVDFEDKTVKQFWRRVRVGAAEACWEWTGTRDAYGYGRFHLNRGYCRAHRYAYGLQFGKLSELIIRYSCDNPACVNPAHLLEGTQKDNMRDMNARGRRIPRPLRGPENARAKFSENEIRAIRFLVEAGVQQKLVAEAFNASRACISFVVNRVTYCEVA